MTIQIKVDTTEVEQGLEELSAKLQNLKPMFKGIGDYMTRSILNRFDKGVDAGGKAWAPLSSATIRQKRNNPKTLQESGKLKNSITYEATDSQVEIGTKGLPYDAIHQLGGQAGRNRKVEIPSRPFVGISQADESMVQKIIERYLQEDK